ASSVELLRALKSRVDQVESKVDAFVSEGFETALSDAEKASSRTGPLAGVPIALKDNINARGWPCTCSSKILKNYVAPYDATVTRKLREAGAVLYGRLNMDEFAMGSSTENSAFKKTKNPWDPSRIPGGSSGGAAAAVSADECFAALGSDTGGSIRQPAGLCGCVGLKPTYGRVSRFGLVAFASSLDQIGPLAKTVEDAALLLGVIAGHDPLDSSSVARPVPDYVASLSKGVQGLRLGLPKEYFVEGMDPRVKSAIQAAIRQLEDLGAKIVEISLPHTAAAVATYYVVATAEASSNLARFDGVRYGFRAEKPSDVLDMYQKTRAEGFGPEVKRRIILGTYVLSSGYYDAYYLRAQKVRTLIRQDFEAAFEQCDAILTPTSPTPAFKLGEKTEDPLQMYLADIYTIAANLAGICGVSVPCGFVEEAGRKLPVGLQILGKAFEEETILRVGHAYERSTDWHRQKPPLS
ncbi:MAG: Asp-tRNA(Asn)/Glu-tRNA(Gln) amidotransferase subunit GatA, partial [Verrucomicrobiae bacterium]|nr:Asp-tRNA(Asn)/Glu-tRNA(Gln) amidotransferase subunit GatA [Verrucomicrobiae bacterium]